jgi:hypothetical protein
MTANRSRVSLGLLLAAGVLAASCGSPQKKEDTFYTSEEYEKNRTSEPTSESTSGSPSSNDPCKGKGGEPAECRNQEDCCPGYECGYDPDRSKILKFCLHG